MIGREFTIDDSVARRELGYVGKTSREAGRQLYLNVAKAAFLRADDGTPARASAVAS